MARVLQPKPGKARVRRTAAYVSTSFVTCVALLDTKLLQFREFDTVDLCGNYVSIPSGLVGDSFKQWNFYQSWTKHLDQKPC